ncbi:hypothetical protein [Paenibacillus melissococcoides]|uniref:hypothetical protein n=1 Tax=Paenibacillus melissococcoides TaxID=2912268 RepID=UPI0038B32208
MYYQRVDENGYYYHVTIYQEALLTYAQHLEREHGERPCTTDLDDSTNYDELDWYKNGSMSFGEKDWDQLVTRLRNAFKNDGPMLQAQGDWDRHYIYHIGTVYRLKGQFLIRKYFHITHSALIDMDTERFAKDLTRIGRWENK